MALSHGPSVVTQGLVLALDAADRNSYPGSGTTWTDLSGNGTTFGNGNYTFPSYSNGYFTFVNNGVTINHIKSSTNIVTTNTDNAYTRIAWFYQTTQSNAWGPIIQNSIGNNSDMGLVTISNKLAFYQYTTTNDYNVQSTGTFSNNVWVMGAITVNRSTQTVTFYINGNYDSQTSINVIGNSSSNDIIIGGTNVDAYGGERMFKGRISSVSHYNRVLTASEIQQNFNALRGRFGI